MVLLRKQYLSLEIIVKGTHHMKGVEPAINKRFRKLFKNAGYQIFLINEFNTSKLCNGCHCENEKFLRKPSKKKKDEGKGKMRLCRGLLRCQSESCKQFITETKMQPKIC